MPLFRRRLAAAIDLGLPPPPPRRPPTLIETVEPATEDSASELERLGSLATSSRRETWRSRDRCLPRRPLERLVGVKSLESAVENMVYIVANQPFMSEIRNLIAPSYLHLPRARRNRVAVRRV